MEIIKKNPSLKISIFIVLGILIGIPFHNSYSNLTIFCILTLSICLTLYFFRFYTSSFIFSLLAIGFIISQEGKDWEIPTPNKIVNEETAILTGEIAQCIKFDSAFSRFIIDGCLDAKVLEKFRSKIILTVRNIDYSQSLLAPGAKIIATVKVKTPQNLTLPNDFRETQYSSSMQASFLARCNSKDVRIDEAPNGINYYRYLIQKHIESLLSKNYDSVAFPVILAMIDGDRSQISQETNSYFALSGIAHALSVSGMHFALVASGIYLLLGFARNRVLKFILFSFLTIIYIFITGASDPAIRSGIMAICFAFIASIERSSNLINITCFSAILILLIYPSSIYSASFQMSISAIIGIAVLFEIFNKKLQLLFKGEKNYISRYIASSFALTLSASLIVSPIASLYFKTYSFASPLANLVTIPLFEISMTWGIIGIIFSYLFYPLANLLFLSSNLTMDLGIFISKLLCSFSWSYIKGDIALLISVLLSLICLYLIFSINLRRLIFRLIVSILIFFTSLYLAEKSYYDNRLQIIPRANLSAIELTSQGKTNYFIFDRKPNKYNFKDLALKDYIVEQSNLTSIFYFGKNSEQLCNNIDSVKRCRKLKLSKNCFYFLLSHLHLNIYPQQYINL